MKGEMFTEAEIPGFALIEEELNLYLDGELPFVRQAELFNQLANNDELRKQMEAVMLFRRITRLENISLSPSADDRFFKRLAELKAGHEKIDRAQDRQPLWRANRPVSIRSGLAAITAVFLVGLLLPMTQSQNTMFLAQEEEQVTFETPRTRVLQSYIYVFEPGLTIEADHSEAGFESGD